jgi:xanthine dehydrogenase accessory factor
MNRTTRIAAVDWLAAGRAAIVVEVVEARGSVPREAGARMLVGSDESVGTVGGGHLELQAIARAREMLRTGEHAAHTAHYPLGPALGQCCGGAVTLGLAPLDAEALAHWPVAAPRFHLQLFGAGHVGRAIARALAPLDVVVDWIDEREDEFPTRFFDRAAEWPAQIRRVCVDAVEAEVRCAPPGAFFLVLTHRHDLDLRLTEAILKRGDFAFFGLIGSKTKRARFVHALEARGFEPEHIARITCPIGLADIEGKEPAVIAASVVAQLLAVRALSSSTSALPLAIRVPRT